MQDSRGLDLTIDPPATAGGTASPKCNSRTLRQSRPAKFLILQIPRNPVEYRTDPLERLLKGLCVEFHNFIDQRRSIRR